MSSVLPDRKSDLEYICFQETVKRCYSTMKSIHLIYITRKYIGIYHEGKQMTIRGKQMTGKVRNSKQVNWSEILIRMEDKQGFQEKT